MSIHGLYKDLYGNIKCANDIYKRGLAPFDYRQLCYMFGDAIDHSIFITSSMAKYMRRFGLNVALDDGGQYKLEV